MHIVRAVIFFRACKLGVFFFVESQLVEAVCGGRAAALKSTPHSGGKNLHAWKLGVLVFQNLESLGCFLVKTPQETPRNFKITGRFLRFFLSQCVIQMNDDTEDTDMQISTGLSNS